MAVRTACSVPHRRAIRWSARSCHAVTPPAVMTRPPRYARSRIAFASKLDLRVVRAEQVAVRPVAGARAAVEQARLGEQHGPGADRGDRASPRRGCRRSQAISVAYRPRGAVWIGVYMSQTITASAASTSSIESVGLDEDVAEAAERLLGRADDRHVEQRVAGLAGRSCPGTPPRPTAARRRVRTGPTPRSRARRGARSAVDSVSSLPRFGRIRPFQHPMPGRHCRHDACRPAGSDLDAGARRNRRCS